MKKSAKNILKKGISIKNNSENNKLNLPKYTNTTINRISQDQQATRPSVVGQMSDLVPQLLSKNKNATYDDWQTFYMEIMPHGIDNAVEKILDKLDLYKKAINGIDEKIVREWMENFILKKTFYGLNAQYKLIEFLKQKGYKVKTANIKDESKNIDLYIDDIPYSLKPDSWLISESNNIVEIEHKIIIYKKMEKTTKYWIHVI